MLIYFSVAPYFVEGNNVTILQQLYEGKTDTLNCTLSMANPAVTTWQFTNTSKSFSNIDAKVCFLNDIVGLFNICQ